MPQFDYVYGADGNLESKTEVQHGTTTPTTYGYDDANQLTNDGAISHSYDETGNRTDTGYSTTYGNRITSDGTWTYSHDNNGNVTSKENITTGIVWEYHYDVVNHLTAVQRWSDNTPSKVLEYDAAYGYNASGLRVTKVEDKDGAGATYSAVTSKYTLDGWNPATSNGLVGRENFAVRAKLNGSNAVETQYLWSDRIDDGLSRIDVGGTTEVRWTLTDFQKSVRTILNGSGTAINDLAYDAFGNVTLETDATKNGDYAWTGRERDVETGLQYNRARWYDPTTGRWLTQDPLGFDAGDSNLYRYVNNAPTMAKDPSGLQVGQVPGVIQKGLGKIGKGVGDEIFDFYDSFLTQQKNKVYNSKYEGVSSSGLQILVQIASGQTSRLFELQRPTYPRIRSELLYHGSVLSGAENFFTWQGKRDNNVLGWNRGAKIPVVGRVG